MVATPVTDRNRRQCTGNLQITLSETFVQFYYTVTHDGSIHFCRVAEMSRVGLFDLIPVFTSITNWKLKTVTGMIKEPWWEWDTLLVFLLGARKHGLVWLPCWFRWKTQRTFLRAKQSVFKDWSQRVMVRRKSLQGQIAHFWPRFPIVFRQWNSLPTDNVIFQNGIFNLAKMF